MFVLCGCLSGISGGVLLYWFLCSKNVLTKTAPLMLYTHFLDYGRVSGGIWGSVGDSVCIVLVELSWFIHFFVVKMY